MRAADEIKPELKLQPFEAAPALYAYKCTSLLYTHASREGVRKGEGLATLLDDGA